MDQKLNIFYKLLGVLTPEIVSKLTTISLGENKLSLTELILGDEADKKIAVAENVVAIEDFQKTKEIEGQVAQNDTTLVEGTTATILEVKKRLKKSQEKMKETEIYDLYKTNSLVDLNQARKNKQDMNKSTNLGVLVNKKQA